MTKQVPTNVRVMDAHEAHVLATARLARREKLGGFAAFFANLFKRVKAPAFAPTRFLSRFSAVPSDTHIALPTASVKAGAGLAFTINADCIDVSDDDGMDVIASYMPALLLEALDESGWAFLVLGETTSTHECEDPYCRAISLTVNDAVIGKSDTDGLTHSVAALVAQASTPQPLYAGEVIFSGTAHGCASDVLGISLAAGDKLTAEIAGLGRVSAQLS